MATGSACVIVFMKFAVKFHEYNHYNIYAHFLFQDDATGLHIIPPVTVMPTISGHLLSLSHLLP